MTKRMEAVEAQNLDLEIWEVLEILEEIEVFKIMDLDLEKQIRIMNKRI